MRGGRLILVVATMVAILVCPLLLRDAILASQLPSAYAASNAFDTGGRVYQNGNNNDNDDDDDDDDDNDNNGDDGDDNDNNGDDGDDNDNVCYANLNSNEEVPCDFVDNDNGVFVPAAPGPEESVNRPTKCFDAGEVGVVQLGTGSYDVTVEVVPHSSFGQTTRLTLRELDPLTVSGLPGPLLDSVVFQLDAQSSCDGVAIGMLPNLVNLGITYNVVPAVDKSRLQIVRLEGGSWVNVDTVPDPVPGNPYISSTIDRAGTYAVIVRP